MILIIAVVAVFLTDDVLLCVTAVPVTDSTLSTVSNTSPPMTKALYDPIHMPSTMGILFTPPRVNPILKTKAPLVPSRIPIQTVRPPIITEEIPASPGAMSLLYVCKFYLANVFTLFVHEIINN